MRDLNFFQIGVLLFFGAAVIVGVVVLATYRSAPSTGEFSAEVVLWGSLPARSVGDLFEHLERELGDDRFKVRYVEVPAAEFDRRFVDALAESRGPDLIFLPHDKLLFHEAKLLAIPFASYPERTFRETFLEEAALFLGPPAPDAGGSSALAAGGVLAVPFSIDPLVMYWNRDLFSSAGIAAPPRLWSEFQNRTLSLTARDAAGNIARSAVALGEFANVAHAKEIFSTLTIQAGNPITRRSERDGALEVVLAGGAQAGGSGQGGDFTSAAAESALRFLLDFSDPAKPTYSWNRSLASSRDAFTGGTLATYFGFAGELADIRERNPNLNFDVTLLPQAQVAPGGSLLRATFGRLTGLAVVKQSKHSGDAFRAATILSSASAQAKWQEITGLPPVRRDLLSEKPERAFASVFYESALLSRAWLDPNTDETSGIFRTMIEGSASGRTRVNEAVSRAAREMEGVGDK